MQVRETGLWTSDSSVELSVAPETNLAFTPCGSINFEFPAKKVRVILKNNDRSPLSGTLLFWGQKEVITGTEHNDWPKVWHNGPYFLASVHADIFGCTSEYVDINEAEFSYDISVNIRIFGKWYIQCWHW